MNLRPANPRALSVATAFSLLLATGLGVLSGGHRSQVAAENYSAALGAVLLSQGPPRTDCTGLLVSVPPDDVRALGAQVAAYNLSNRQVGGRCVDVRLIPQAPGQTADLLASGWPKGIGPAPQVWLPGSTSWVSILRNRTATSAPALVPQAVSGIAQSPFVIAMPRPMAEALGWPEREIGFSDLIGIGLDPGGWGKVGHPDWGPLRLGKTSPLLSTTGLEALVAAYFAAAGTSGDLTINEASDPKVLAFVKGVELATVHYGDSSMAFLRSLRQADDAGASMSYVSAVALEERQVLAYNTGTIGDLANARQAPKVPLAAIYPREGTLISDNPFVVLNGGWTTEPQKAAGADLLSFLQAPAQQQRFQAEGFRDTTGAPGSLIKPSLGLLPGQPTKVIKPPPAGVLNAMQAAWWLVRKPARVLVIVDVSGSMDEQIPGAGVTKLALVKLALGAALDQVGDDDEVGLWTFSSSYAEEVPVGPVRNQRAALKKAVSQMHAGGGTQLYTTIGKGIARMSREIDPTHITAIVVLTDGQDDDGNGASLNSLVQSELSTPVDKQVRVFTIAYGADASFAVLSRIAQATNANSYDATNPAVIKEVFNAVLSNF